MFIVAGSFLAYVSLGVYENFWGPVQFLGPDLVFIGGKGMVVVGGRGAGLQPGDRIPAVDGQTIRNVRDWNAIRANTEVGRRQRWEVARGNERLQLEQTFDRVAAWSQSRLANLQKLATLGLLLAPFALSLLIALRRPYDPVARIGAWLTATASIGFGIPEGCPQRGVTCLCC
jgi:hypothetical protein